MLSELTILNFAIIDRLTLAFGPGFNVLSGETGAGKSIIVDAVSVLLGGRADATVIRSGTEEARVEGLFHLPPDASHGVVPLLEECGLSDDGDGVILSRQIRRSGRNVCRVNGRAISLSVLRRIGEHLVDIHGQGEHLSLLNVRNHVLFLDRFGGLDAQREAFAQEVGRLRKVRDDLGALIRDERELARRVDLLTYQLTEIESARINPGEEQTLDTERNRLANAERLAELAEATYLALSEGDDSAQRSAADAIGEALNHLGTASRLDDALNELLQSTEAISYQLDELVHSLRGYRDGIEYDPDRLNQIEDRVGLLAQLKRKYGETLGEVLTYADQARAELQSITHGEERIGELQQEEAELLREIGQSGANLSDARRASSSVMEQGIEGELSDLRMDRARFVIDSRWVEDENGAFVGEKRYAFSVTGLDRIEYLISANIGEEPKPLARIASGGETSRLMLAMRSILSAAGPVPTLIFDEIDAGIGGRLGDVVGRKLWELTATQQHQVLCVTHLPQMACYADEHFRVAKALVSGRTVTTVENLDERSRHDELALMMRGTTSEVARQDVKEMMAHANNVKESHLDQS